jgi:hypothetical protein
MNHISLNLYIFATFIELWYAGHSFFSDLCFSLSMVSLAGIMCTVLACQKSKLLQCCVVHMTKLLK